MINATTAISAARIIAVLILLTLSRESAQPGRSRFHIITTKPTDCYQPAFTDRLAPTAVFDGFRTAGNPGSRGDHVNIHVVYTPEGETADAYIERLASEIGKNDRVSIITGDTMIRISAMRSGVLRVSPEEFMLELAEAEKQLGEILSRSNFLAHQTRGEDAVREKRKERDHESV